MFANWYAELNLCILATFPPVSAHSVVPVKICVVKHEGNKYPPEVWEIGSIYRSRYVGTARSVEDETHSTLERIGSDFDLSLRVTCGLTFGPKPGVVDRVVLRFFKLTSIQ